MSGPPVRVAADAAALAEGDGLRFGIVLDGVTRDAFAVRWRGAVHAWINACRHQALPLDFGDARFFDRSADALVCTHHGARFRPDSGECVEGPCRGAFLTPLTLEQRDGALWCTGRGTRAGG